MLRNLLRRWLIGEDLTENVMQLYSQQKAVLNIFGSFETDVERVKKTIRNLHRTSSNTIDDLHNLWKRIDALEATLERLKITPVQQEGALWLRLPSDDELYDLINNFPVFDTRPYPTPERLLFDFGRQWQSMLTTGKMVSCDKSEAVAHAISEALSKLRVPVNPGNNGDQPDQLSDSPDA